MMATASRPIEMARLNRPPETGGSGSGSGSGSRRSGLSRATCKLHAKLFAADQLVPLALSLRLGASLKSGSDAARARLNQPVQLLHAREAKFAGCWFSQAIDLGNASGAPAFWVLQKTARNAWSLRLRCGTSNVAAYHLKANKHSFPIKLRRGRANKAFQEWPATITISE